MRTMLREALKQAIETRYEAPLDFGTGFLDNINSESVKLPCLWICPFDMANKTGRSEGTKTYRGTMYLLESSLKGGSCNESGQALTPAEKDVRWDYMEAVAIDALDSLVGMGDIVDVSQSKGLPNEGTYTGYDDISMKVTFEVTIQYCHERS